MTPEDRKALERVANGAVARPSGRQVILIPAQDIRSERIRWLWRGRFPLRSLCVVAGEKGLGKSLLTNARLPAEATRGLLPGELEGKPMDVLVCTAEDDWRSVVKPRLIAHDADLERVHRVAVEDKDGESLLTLPDDVHLLETQIAQLREAGRTVGMMVIDPIGAFLSTATDTHRDASVRRALAPLAALADTLDIVVVVVAHLTKDESSRLINRVSGAGAFVNAARSVLVLARNPDDPDGEQGHERVLVHVGSNWGNYAPTLATRVEEQTVHLDDDSYTDVGHLLITGESDVGVEDLQRGPDDNGGHDVEEEIAEALADGPQPSRTVKAKVAEKLGCAKKTVERAGVRMSKRTPPELIITPKEGFQGTNTWALPTGDTNVDAKGTHSGPLTVPIAKGTVPTGDSLLNGDKGHLPNGCVLVDPDAEIQRVIEKFPELETDQ